MPKIIRGTTPSIQLSFDLADLSVFDGGEISVSILTGRIVTETVTVNGSPVTRKVPEKITKALTVDAELPSSGYFSLAQSDTLALIAGERLLQVKAITSLGKVASSTPIPVVVVDAIDNDVMEI